MTALSVRADRRQDSKTAALALLSLVTLNVVLGGSIFGSPLLELVLQLAACIALVWCIVDSSLGKLTMAAWRLLAIGLFAVVVALLQLFPLPFSLWQALPGRESVAEAVTIVGVESSVLPVSLAPEATLASLFWLLPPAAVFLITAKIDWRAVVSVVRWGVPALAAASAILGLAQITTSDIASLYLHDGPARGHAAGFFQVVNYQPTLQLMAIPFLAVLVARVGANYDSGDAYQAQALLLVTLLIVLLAGIVTSGSLAGYVLTIPVLLASLPVALQRRLSLKVGLMLVGGVAALAAGAFYVAGSPLLRGVANTDLGSGPLSRIDTWTRASAMAQDYFPVGAGLGAFRDAFGAYEDPATVTNKFVAHAHNDYIEVIVELGLPGILLILAVVVWWAAMTVAIWRRPAEQGLRTRKAASVAVAVVLLHSLVDSPARTETIACLTALCLGLMALGPRKSLVVEERAARIMAHRHIQL